MGEIGCSNARLKISLMENWLRLCRGCDRAQDEVDFLAHDFKCAKKSGCSWKTVIEVDS